MKLSQGRSEQMSLKNYVDGGRQMKDSKWWNLMKILLWQVHFMDVEINALIIALLVYHFPYFKYHLTVFISHYIVSYVMIMFGFLQLGLTTYKH